MKKPKTKKDLSIILDEAFNIAKSRLDYVRKNLPTEKQAIRSQVLRDYTLKLFEASFSHVDEDILLPEELLVIALAGAQLTLQKYKGSK